MTTELYQVDGARFQVRPGTHDTEMIREIFEDRYYTCNGWDIPPDATVLDLGGGIGGFALYAAIHGAAAVYTFEPYPDSFDLLQTNIDGHPSINAFRYAVDTARGLVHMSAPTVMDDGIVNTGSPGIAADGVQVIAVSIHDVLAMRAHWDVVKLDIEGHEYPLIEAMTPHEFAKVDMFTMEFHHDDEATTRARGKKLARHLRGHGYVTEVSWAWGQQGRLRARR